MIFVHNGISYMSRQVTLRHTHKTEKRVANNDLASAFVLELMGAHVLIPITCLYIYGY